MKLFYLIIISSLIKLFNPLSAYAATDVPIQVTSFTGDTLSLITIISTATAVFFLIRSGYLYIVSTGNPEVINEAKKTIRNALIGLVIVLTANLLVSVMNGALIGNQETTSITTLPVTQIESISSSDGLTQVLIDAINGFIQNIVETSTKPIVDGVMTFLTTTPTLLNNQSILKFWLIILGITNTLFVLVVALLGLQFMSAATFGFDEIEFKHLLPRIALAFLGANVSLFLVDYMVKISNALVSGVISATGGLNHAWIVNAVNVSSLTKGTTPVIILIFLLIFLILAMALLFIYISRLIIISMGAVLSPLIFLLWTLPKTSDLAEITVKSYLVSVFTVFIHVVTIQLAGSFLTLPEQTDNSLISIAVAIGLLFVLIKTPPALMQLVLFAAKARGIKKTGSQMVNMVSTGTAADRARRTINSFKNA